MFVAENMSQFFRFLMKLMVLTESFPKLSRSLNMRAKSNVIKEVDQCILLVNKFTKLGHKHVSTQVHYFVDCVVFCKRKLKSLYCEYN